MTNRSFQDTGYSKYRWGFNGKEDDEDGGFQDYGMRGYLQKVGRFMSVDPITAKYPELTPYQFASNKPINSIDLDGLEAYEIILKFDGFDHSRVELRLIDADAVKSVTIVNGKQRTYYLYDDLPFSGYRDYIETMTRIQTDARDDRIKFLVPSDMNARKKYMGGKTNFTPVFDRQWFPDIRVKPNKIDFIPIPELDFKFQPTIGKIVIPKKEKPEPNFQPLIIGLPNTFNIPIIMGLNPHIAPLTGDSEFRNMANRLNSTSGITQINIRIITEMSNTAPNDTWRAFNNAMEAFGQSLPQRLRDLGVSGSVKINVDAKINLVPAPSVGTGNEFSVTPIK